MQNVPIEETRFDPCSPKHQQFVATLETVIESSKSNPTISNCHASFNCLSALFDLCVFTGL
jgi:hypothetical protein